MATARGRTRRGRRAPLAPGHGPQAARQPAAARGDPQRHPADLFAGTARDHADEVAERSSLAAAFTRLSDEDRETLALIAWDGLQPREAAVVTGCSAATFAVRAHRARRRLAALLEAADGSPALDAQGGRS
jgi:DNA-directed RNA polymerase specialized sigma24 family protein